MRKELRIITLFLIIVVATPLLSDGFIVVPGPVPGDKPFPLAVKYHHVRVKIDENYALTTVDQEFYNPSAYRVEGKYVFPVPEGATIEDFSLYIDGKKTEARMLGAKEARSQYEAIVRSMKDPALLEYIGRGLLQVSIYPIEARSTRRITLSYGEEIVSNNNMFEYLYPLNTEKFSSSDIDSVLITVEIESQDTVNSVTTPGFQSDVLRKSSGGVTVSYEEEKVRPDQDFRLIYTRGKKSTEPLLLTWKPNQNEDGWFYLKIDPLQAESVSTLPKNIAFVVDVSGSMRGEKIEQAKKALHYCVKNLNSKDAFQIVTFSTGAQKLFRTMKRASQANKKKAHGFIDEIEALGGTAVETAYEKLFSGQDESQVDSVIFLTDGKPTIGEIEGPALLKKIQTLNKNNSKIYTFGIGYDINTILLDRISDHSGGLRTYISPDEKIEDRIAAFYDSVRHPVLSDISLHFSDTIRVSKTHPQKIPDLYKGVPLVLSGRYRGSGRSTLTLRGQGPSGEEIHRYTVFFEPVNQINSSAGRIWASRRVGYLLDHIRFYGENSELTEEITKIARRFGIITPYTSYLVTEEEQQRLSKGELPVEQSIFSQAVSEDEAGAIRKEYDAMRQTSGKESVESSVAIQKMKDSVQSEENSGKDSGSFVMRSVFIRGRAFYLVQDVWIDSLVYDFKGDSVTIEFGSEEYFNLLDKDEALSGILFLGKRIRFIYKGKLIEIV